jgi:hypothetical protein
MLKEKRGQFFWVYLFLYKAKLIEEPSPLEEEAEKSWE